MQAIILAAGMGKRLEEFTQNTPKCLLRVNGRPIIERQIEFLLTYPVEKIIIVTGYLAEKLDCLATVPQIQLIYNPFYESSNNIYSLWLASDWLGDSLVLEADLYIHQNILANLPQSKEHSFYFGNKKVSDQEEWVFQTDKDGF